MESVFLKVHEILKERNLQDSVMLTSLTGSRLYGLDTPDSDFDVHVVVFQKLQKGFYHEYEDFDLTIISYDVFLEGLSEAAPVSVDILFSETSEISTTFESFLKSYRVSAQRYAAHSRRLAELDFLKSEKVSEARGKESPQSLLPRAHAG
jgi:predicted nucleotidyltransferase